MNSLMFVCLGNICRSPAAEAIARSMLQSTYGDATLAIDSAGTAGYHIGKPPDARMISAARKRGYALVSRAQALAPRHVRERTLVIAMDRDNYRDILRISEGDPKNVQLLSHYLDESWPTDVPDPYYGGDAGFEYVLDMLEAAIPKILARLVSLESQSQT